MPLPQGLNRRATAPDTLGGVRFDPAKHCRLFVAMLGIACAASATLAGEPEVGRLPLWPAVADHVQGWWRHGFPGRVEGAPWHWCLRGGRWAFVLDTAKMTVPHVGPLPEASYGAAVSDDAAIDVLPAAELELAIEVDGVRYRCVGSDPWNGTKGPRIVEAGRWLHRSDVNGLVFEATDGRRLAADTRLEATAWPDRLALALAARPPLQPVSNESVDTTDSAAAKRPPAAWNDAALAVRLTTSGTTIERRAAMPPAPAAAPAAWGEVAIVFDPMSLATAAPVDAVHVSAVALDAGGQPTGEPLAVTADEVRGWQRVSFDAVQPLLPADAKPQSPADPAATPSATVPRDPRNDVLDRVRLTLANPTDREQPVRLLLDKTGAGLHGRGSNSITGISAMLRDADGHPIGIPVQLSKNWHDRPNGEPYHGYWFHGAAFLRVPARATIDVEATIAHARWGGRPAASHAQLSLCGWGSNQLWDEAALGAWGETICFEPDQVQGRCSILDVRPLLVRSSGGNGFWNWTAGVSGGDFFRVFDAAGSHLPPVGMTTTYTRQGPCLTEVTYAGRIGGGVRHATTVSLARTDDLVRCVYRLRLDVDRPLDVSRCVIFQLSADTHGYTRERKMAVGDASGLVREWNTRWGGDTYRTEPLECGGPVQWMSLHEAVRLDGSTAGAWANRGLVIREWRAKLGGRDTKPFVAERGVNWGNAQASTLDVLLPPDVKRLEPGDFVEAVVEQLVLPQTAADYYGPDERLRAALAEMAGTWRLVHREATGNERVVEVTVGRLERLQPDVRIAADDGRVECTIRGGLGCVPITVTGLPSHRAGRFTIDGEPLEQQVHGDDFWQTDYDAGTGTWSQTVTVPLPGGEPHTMRFGG